MRVLTIRVISLIETYGDYQTVLARLFESALISSSATHHLIR